MDSLDLFLGDFSVGYQPHSHLLSVMYCLDGSLQTILQVPLLAVQLFQEEI